MIKLFDIQDGKVIPTEHCYTINWLKIIMDVFPDNYIKVYAYIFYMAYPGEENPYFNLPFDSREELILRDIGADFSTEEDCVLVAVAQAQVMYETPTVRAYKGITTMLDNLTDYMQTTAVTAGRDGNITALLRIAKEFDGIRQSFKGVAKDLANEQTTSVRGGKNLAYDHMQ